MEEIISQLHCIWLSTGRQLSGTSLDRRFELIKKGFVSQTFASLLSVYVPWSSVLRCIWDLGDTSNQNTQTPSYLILWIYNDDEHYEALLLSDTDNLVIKIILPVICPYGAMENSGEEEHGKSPLQKQKCEYCILHIYWKISNI